MDLKQLKYFARIVELESITAAAQSLFVAQPSLSQHVANLEAELGVKLLHRGAHGARATTPGELLYQYAKTILRQVEEATVAVKQQSHDPAGHVTLGMPTSTSRMVAVELLRKLTGRHKQISLEIVEGSSADLADLISRQKLDLTVAVDVQDNARFDIQPLLTEELLLVGPGGLPADAPVPLEQVCKLPLVLPSFPNSVRVRMERASTERGLRYQVIAETSAATVMAGVARAGLAWTILPWSALSAEDRATLQCLPIAGRPLTRTLSLCVSKAAAANTACAAVCQALTELVQRKVGDGSWLHVELASGRR
jgi:LysR family transcriptional regulator, nitrogen assimilation regulatory protein